jgi:hypothetical protein
MPSWLWEGGEGRTQERLSQNHLWVKTAFVFTKSSMGCVLLFKRMP